MLGLNDSQPLLFALKKRKRASVFDLPTICQKGIEPIVVLLTKGKIDG